MMWCLLCQSSSDLSLSTRFRKKKKKAYSIHTIPVCRHCVMWKRRRLDRQLLRRSCGSSHVPSLPPHLHIKIETSGRHHCHPNGTAMSLPFTEAYIMTSPTASVVYGYMKLVCTDQGGSHTGTEVTCFTATPPSPSPPNDSTKDAPTGRESSCVLLSPQHVDFLHSLIV